MGWFERARIGWEERAVTGLGRVAHWRAGSNGLAAHLLTGMRGETAAFFYLRRKGYVVVARRWSSGELAGDVDLIAWFGSVLCFVEVKTRTARDDSPAEIAVDSHKRKTLKRLARQYVRQLPQDAAPPVRFDVLSVYLVPQRKKEFFHFEGAFEWDESPREGEL
jgi:putative endonuclease